MPVSGSGAGAAARQPCSCRTGWWTCLRQVRASWRAPAARTPRGSGALTHPTWRSVRNPSPTRRTE